MPLRLIAPDGRVRNAHVVLPPGWHELAPLPVVLAYHGGGADAVGALGMAGKARIHEVCFSGDVLDQFVTVYVEAVSMIATEGSGGSFHCGFAGDDALLFEPDEVGFVNLLLDTLQSRLTRGLSTTFGRVGVDALDPERVHAIGFSNGGMMVYRLAIELGPAWPLASFCVASGTIGGEREQDAPLVYNDPVAAGVGPMSVLLLHARNDPVVLYDGGTPVPVPDSALPDVALWRGIDGTLFLPNWQSVLSAEASWKRALGIVARSTAPRPWNRGNYLPVFDDELAVASSPLGVVARAVGASYGHKWPNAGLPDTARMIWHFFRRPQDFT